MEEQSLNLSRISFPLDKRTLQHKRALIVGINEYKGQILRPLVSCESDAISVYRTLKDKLQFSVDLVLNPTRAEFEESIKNFAKKLKRGDIAIFYFAGHAGQFQGENYLFAKDAVLDQDNGEAQLQGCSLKNKVMTWLQQEEGECYFLILLDACRLDQKSEQLYLATRQASTDSYNSLDRTLFFPEQIFLKQYDLVFACQPGKYAIDVGDGQQGYMAEAFCKCVCEAVSWSDVVMNIKKRVVLRSGGRQRPQNLNNLLTQLYLVSKQVQSRSKAELSDFLSACQNGLVENMEIELKDGDFDQNGELNLGVINIPLFINNVSVSYQKQWCDSISGSFDASGKNITINLGSYLHMEVVTFQNLSCNFKGTQFNTVNVKGLEVKRGNLSFYGLHTLVADGNYVEESPQNGISIRGCEYLYLKKVAAIDSKYNGIIFIDNKHIQITKMLVTDSGELGVSIQGSLDAKLKNISVFGCGDIGVELKDVTNFLLQTTEIDGGDNKSKHSSGVLVHSSVGDLVNVKIQNCPIGVVLKAKSKIQHQNLKIGNCSEFIKNYSNQ